ncbi:Histone-lysine N-methyltransferase SETMAR [Eumeta japonica]|uniref:Histone-lysine N-methyltransferase SETMAR n=1 Tax=Eumeta variegata TaxID=151549 RepID=A0A4C1Y5C8_EUMVA|nr:Histone-lysine N-methyltransferase SETMAR [Eumeta japonica]
MNFARVDLAQIESMPFWNSIEQDRHVSSYDIAEELGTNHNIVMTPLEKAGCTKKLDTWIPHEFTKINLINRVLTCESLLKHNITEPFLKRLVTVDEKYHQERTVEITFRRCSYASTRTPIKMFQVYTHRTYARTHARTYTLKHSRTPHARMHALTHARTQEREREFERGGRKRHPN